MATYYALVKLDFFAKMLLEYSSYILSHVPHLQEIIENVQKEIKWFEVFLERLDLMSRIRMRDSLQRVKDAADALFKAFHYCTQNMDVNQVKQDKDKYLRELEDFRQQCQTFIGTLYKMEEEYLKQDTSLPKDDEAVLFKSKMVGLSDEFSQLKKDTFLICEIRDELVFSLAGMAGIGKTCLAKKLFEDLDISEFFDHRAWVTVGKTYQSEEIVQSIQAQLGIDEHDMLTEGYLAKYLMDKCCFIVLDDVWDLELVQNCLNINPCSAMKSRILITTRIQHEYSFPYHQINMRLLNKQESWDLMCNKIFAQNGCPPELEKVGKMIAEKCDGLPLTIVTVANLLLKTPESQWIQVAEQKKHQLFIDAYDEISKVLRPSFDYLREESKLSFIYMGVFPQICKIPKSKLINLWIVEKIIEKRSFQSLEISCIECLQYLAKQNVVMVYQKSSTLFNDLFERIKTCGLHSSWWHFCYKEARKNKVFHVMDSDTDALKEVIESQSRLTIHNNVLFGIKAVCKSMEENCQSTVHSLLCLGPYHRYQVPICYGLKLLKKLDALNIRFYEFPLEVLELVKLRYLALTCNGSLPSSISKLWKLQYLTVHRHLILKFGAPSYLPVEIWDMKRLKHLHVMGSDLPDISGTFLPNLLTLSDVSFNSCTNGVIGRIPNIKKLGIRIALMPDAVEPLCCFDHISHLNELQSLKYDIVNPTNNFGVVAPLVQLSMFPLTLKKLYLSGLGYPWKEMSTIASLPNLEVLKLRNNAFHGPYWEVEKDQFPMLSFLELEDIDLEILKGRDSFKCLKKLCLKHCYNLRKLKFTINREFVSNFEIVDCNPQIVKHIQKTLSKTVGLPVHFSVQYSWKS